MQRHINKIIIIAERKTKSSGEISDGSSQSSNDEQFVTYSINIEVSYTVSERVRRCLLGCTGEQQLTNHEQLDLR